VDGEEGEEEDFDFAVARGAEPAEAEETANPWLGGGVAGWCGEVVEVFAFGLVAARGFAFESVLFALEAGLFAAVGAAEVASVGDEFAFGGELLPVGGVVDFGESAAAGFALARGDVDEDGDAAERGVAGFGDALAEPGVVRAPGVVGKLAVVVCVGIEQVGRGEDGDVAFDAAEEEDVSAAEHAAVGGLAECAGIDAEACGEFFHGGVGAIGHDGSGEDADEARDDLDFLWAGAEAVLGGVPAVVVVDAAI